MKTVRFVGLDVHAQTIAVAVAEPDGEVRSVGVIPNHPAAVSKLMKKLGKPTQLRVCYEAGPRRNDRCSPPSSRRAQSPRRKRVQASTIQLNGSAGRETWFLPDFYLSDDYFGRGKGFEQYIRHDRRRLALCRLADRDAVGAQRLSRPAGRPRDVSE